MSAILSADDLNDFIGPGLACIKPVPVVKKSAEESEIQIDAFGTPLEVSIDGTTTALSTAQISLSDCLACSGCITSAEEVLVAKHSHNELLKAVRSGEKQFVASVCHQARASLATAYDVSVDTVDRCLINLFVNRLGFRYIVGTGMGRQLSLISEASKVIEAKASGLVGPMLSSVCPGWVCYAEKTHPYILPHMSTVKSPQQITGCLLKELGARGLGVSRSEVYHLSIMPCFDKKLEAARPEQEDPDEGNVDVDCVITAKEVVQLLEQEGLSFLDTTNDASIDAEELLALYERVAPEAWPFVRQTWLSNHGSSSGGYGLHYLTTLQAQYPDQTTSINRIDGRNGDVWELRLIENASGKSLGSAAIVNGFRNIQNLVRKLRPGPAGPRERGILKGARRGRRGKPEGEESEVVMADASKCDYVEIMACPSGCINGGGQIASVNGLNDKAWIHATEAKYESIPNADIEAPLLRQWAGKFCESAGLSETRLLHTHFIKVEAPTDPAVVLLGAKW